MPRAGSDSALKGLVRLQLLRIDEPDAGCPTSLALGDVGNKDSKPETFIPTRWLSGSTTNLSERRRAPASRAPFHHWPCWDLLVRVRCSCGFFHSSLCR